MLRTMVHGGMASAALWAAMVMLWGGPAWAGEGDNGQAGGAAASTGEAAAQPAEKKEDGGSEPVRVKLEIAQGGEPFGEIVLELNVEQAPISTYNFVRYVRDGFYDGTVFHRVIPGFMIQGGGFDMEMDQKTAGLREPIRNEWDNGLKNRQGTIAMARTSAPHSATSQFFINVADNAMLDVPRGGAAYAVFGKVVEGMDVVEKIRDAEKVRHPKYASDRSGAVTPDPLISIEEAAVVGEVDVEKLEKRAEEAVKEAEAREKERAAEARKWREDFEGMQAKRLPELLKEIEVETGKELQKTDSGLMYFVLEEGEGESPDPTDRVTVHYTGWLVNGQKFDSSVDRGQPATFGLNQVIGGWTEGVSMMKPGAKYKFIIPPALGYGERGAPPRIPGGAVLIFDVELISVAGQ